MANLSFHSLEEVSNILDEKKKAKEEKLEQERLQKLQELQDLSKKSSINEMIVEETPTDRFEKELRDQNATNRDSDSSSSGNQEKS